MHAQIISEQSQLVEELSPPQADHDIPQLQLSPSRAVYLPSELIQQIHESCDKKTLKSLRLTCRDWNHAVIPLLFDRVFISAREKDLEVFHNITESEHLAANIKELLIDATGALLGMSKEVYEHCLLGQLKRLFDRLPLALADSEPLRVIPLRSMGYTIVFNFNKAPELSCCSRRVDFRVSKDGEDVEGAHAGFENMIRESHAAYLAMAEAEEEVLRNETDLMAKLQFGVKRLIRLQSVIVDDGIWESHPDEKFATFDPGLWYGDGSGPPAARVRNPMHLHPSPYIPNGTLAATLFKAVAGALAVSPRPLKCFRISSNQDPGFMLSPIDCRPLDSWLCTDSFSALEYLELRLPHQNWDASTKPAVPGSIPTLLSRNQASLRQLKIEPGGYYHDRPGDPRLSAMRRIRRYAFHAIFINGLHMPNLVSLSLGMLALRAYKLMDLLRLHCPKLKDLAIGRIDLKYGIWPGLLTMFKGLKLDHFGISQDASYWQCARNLAAPQETDAGASQELSCTEKNPFLNLPALTDYVLGAATHPCYQEILWKGNPREYHRKVMSAVVCCWPQSMRKSVVDDYHAAIGTIQVPLESRLNLDWDRMGLTRLLPSPSDPPGQTIKDFMLQNT